MASLKKNSLYVYSLENTIFKNIIDLRIFNQFLKLRFTSCWGFNKFIWIIKKTIKTAVLGKSSVYGRFIIHFNERLAVLVV
jgi:hypothetical protein